MMRIIDIPSAAVYHDSVITLIESAARADRTSLSVSSEARERYAAAIKQADLAIRLDVVDAVIGAGQLLFLVQFCHAHYVGILLTDEGKMPFFLATLKNLYMCRQHNPLPEEVAAMVMAELFPNEQFVRNQKE